jgi:hypothetical protein
LRQQCLLGERSGRTEIGNATRCRHRIKATSQR